MSESEVYHQILSELKAIKLLITDLTPMIRQVVREEFDIQTHPRESDYLYDNVYSDS